MKETEEKQPKPIGFVVPFTIAGTIWGIASILFVLSQIGREEAASSFSYIIFFPAYLSALVHRLTLRIFGVGLWRPTLGGYLLTFALILFFGLIIGLVIGLAVDSILKRRRLL